MGLIPSTVPDIMFSVSEWTYGISVLLGLLTCECMSLVAPLPMQGLLITLKILATGNDDCYIKYTL